MANVNREMFNCCVVKQKKYKVTCVMLKTSTLQTVNGMLHCK